MHYYFLKSTTNILWYSSGIPDSFLFLVLLLEVKLLICASCCFWGISLQTVRTEKNDIQRFISSLFNQICTVDIYKNWFCNTEHQYTFGFSLNFMVFVLQSIHIGFFWHKNEIKKVSIVETVVTQHKTVYKMIWRQCQLKTTLVPQNIVRWVNHASDKYIGSENFG